MDRASVDYAVKLTRHPHDVVKDDVHALHEVGLDDETISHAVQVISLFNYYNRIVDGLGADDEPDWD